ncbi:hypothetical protein DRE_06711 [Drechslerella stenobrocha 248]|uniref:DNA polymerase eta n=1 Tax=Drechslerella stenobrocha 248 TaxID=1043628 RepID=W7HN54_9PEZI|nr:hypothetical protein DRE_06711 [Drechslerella stenobrocha 248]
MEDYPSPSGAQRPKSKFSYKDLLQMSRYNVNSPLRVIAHIDLDAFYAQCEMVRLGVPEDQPLAVQQWDALIAVNYPARKYGITRMRNVAEAKRKCPNLLAVHVATWRVEDGQAVMGYHGDRGASIATNKVSLDHYRRESKKILSIFRSNCPKVEKASVDESFLDLSGMVFERLVKRHDEELGVIDGELVAPYGDTTEKLRLPEVAAVDWADSHLVDLDGGEDAEEDAIDWDDIAIGIAAEIVRDIRQQVRDKLGYTCSAGIARNKMLAKLGSGYKKPNQQTIVRNRAVAQFLSDMKFTSIRNLGGKLGSEVAAAFATERVSEVLSVPLETFKTKLGDETGTWLYKTIRGIDTTDVITRTEIKSMLSAKSFTPQITNFQQGEGWLKVFCADIISRVNEESEESEHANDDENSMMPGSQPTSLRRPKSMTLHHRHKRITKSRQAPIPLGRLFDEDLLLPIAKNLLKQIEQEGWCWPCNNLSLSVGGFDDVGRGTNHGIGGWLVRGDEAKMAKEASAKRLHEDSGAPEPAGRETKKQKVGIKTFFQKEAGAYERDDDERIFYSDEKDEFAFDEDTLYSDPLKDINIESNQPVESSPRAASTEKSTTPPTLRTNSSSRTRFFSKETTPNIGPVLPAKHTPQETTEMTFPCSRCNNKPIQLHQLDEHSDWHFAKDLLEEDRIRPNSAGAASASSDDGSKSAKVGEKQQQQPSSQPTSTPPVKRGRGRPPKYAIVQYGEQPLEKGQKKLAFGK